MNFKIQEILTTIALENHITLEQAKDIFYSEFECARKVMKEGTKDEPDTFKNINFIKLGKLYAKPGVILKMKEKKKKNV